MENTAASLNSTLSLLRGTNQNLKDGTKDFARLRTILQTNKVFDIVTETDIAEAKVDVAKETEPQILALIEKINVELSRMERKQRSLTSKAQLQSVRLEQTVKPRQDTSIKNSTTVDVGIAEQLDKLKQLQQKKERLAYSLSRINLKKRKVRMSMAFSYSGNN